MTESLHRLQHEIITLDGDSPETSGSGKELVSETRLEMLVARYQSLASELSAARDTLEAERQKNDKLTAALLKLQGECKAYRDLLDRQQYTADELFDLVQRSRTDKSESRGAIAHYERMAADATHSLNLVTSSMAWRLTRPLRWVRRILINRVRV